MLFVSNLQIGVHINNSFQGAKRSNLGENPRIKIREGFDEIETLLDKRIVISEGYPKTTQYLVKWKGYMKGIINGTIEKYYINMTKEYEKSINGSLPVSTYEHKDPNMKNHQKDELEFYVHLIMIPR